MLRLCRPALRGVVKWKDPFTDSFFGHSDIFNDMGALSSQLSRLSDSFHKCPVSMAGEGRTFFMPKVDINETAKLVCIVAELPGLQKQDIELSLKDNVLTLTGEKKVEEKKEGENAVRSERFYGKFTRSFQLPEECQETIDAKFEDGVLKIEVPKSEVVEQETKKIPIN
eukprot:Platyproteum_vivax@DN7863_c0_g1_i1.p1